MFSLPIVVSFGVLLAFLSRKGQIGTKKELRIVEIVLKKPLFRKFQMIKAWLNLLQNVVFRPKW